jgi:7-cyano-7-deazaguanine reductase
MPHTNLTSHDAPADFVVHHGGATEQPSEAIAPSPARSAELLSEWAKGSLEDEAKVLTSRLKALGFGSTHYTFDGPDAGLLEKFASPFGSNQSRQVTIRAPEFTSLCPITGQPDFATIFIEYTPLLSCVESKSLKLYLTSFRNAGEFHEACVARILRDLVKLLDPVHMIVRGEFSPRGGISFWPEASHYRGAAGTATSSDDDAARPESSASQPAMAGAFNETEQDLLGVRPEEGIEHSDLDVDPVQEPSPPKLDPEDELFLGIVRRKEEFCELRGGSCNCDPATVYCVDLMSR